MLAVLTFLMTIVSAQAADTHDAAAVAEITRLEEIWNTGHEHGDAQALEKLWADDFVVTVPGMRMMTKDDVIGVWRNGLIGFQRYETSDVRIRVYENAAIVTGRLLRSRSTNGRMVDDDWRF